MKFGLFLSLAILCLSVSQSRSRICAKSYLKSKEVSYLRCFNTPIAEFFSRAYLKQRSYEEVPKRCREAKERISDCYKCNKNGVVGFCENKHLNESYQIFTNAYQEALTFICRNNGRDFNDLNLPLSMVVEERCHLLPLGEIQDCEKKYPFVTLSQKYSDSFCSKGIEGLKCIKEALEKKKCNTIQRTVLYNFYESLRNHTPCGKSN